MNDREYVCDNADCDYSGRANRPGLCPKCSSKLELWVSRSPRPVVQSGLCVKCSKLPAKQLLQNHCRDCFKEYFLNSSIKLRAEMFQEVSRLQKKIEIFHKLLCEDEGVSSPQAAYKHRCLCGAEFTDWMLFEAHIENSNGGIHTTKSARPAKKPPLHKTPAEPKMRGSNKVFDPEALA